MGSDSARSQFGAAYCYGHLARGVPTEQHSRSVNAASYLCVEYEPAGSRPDYVLARRMLILFRNAQHRSWVVLPCLVTFVTASLLNGYGGTLFESASPQRSEQVSSFTANTQ